MALIKEESEEMKIEDFGGKHEETEEHTDLMVLNRESQEPNNMEVKVEKRGFMIGEKSTPTKVTCSQKGAPKTKSTRYYSCTHCGWTFNHKRNFEAHVRTHTGERPFTCEQCGKNFSQTQNLKVHMRLHTGEKPFKCQHCGKAYAFKGNLDSHVRVHTGEKPYTCNYCGKRFTQNGNLEVHVRTHTGEKPFTCLQCNKSFTYQRGLKRHMQTHAGKMWHCSECGKIFKKWGYFQDHLRFHSKGKQINSDDQSNKTDAFSIITLTNAPKK